MESRKALMMNHDQSLQNNKKVSSEKKPVFSLDDCIDEMQRQNQQRSKASRITKTKSTTSIRPQFKDLTKKLQARPSAEADPYDCLNSKFSSTVNNLALSSSMRYLQRNLNSDGNSPSKAKKQHFKLAQQQEQRFLAVYEEPLKQTSRKQRKDSIKNHKSNSSQQHHKQQSNVKGTNSSTYQSPSPFDKKTMIYDRSNVSSVAQNPKAAYLQLSQTLDEAGFRSQANKTHTASWGGLKGDLKYHQHQRSRVDAESPDARTHHKSNQHHTQCLVPAPMTISSIKRRNESNGNNILGSCEQTATKNINHNSSRQMLNHTKAKKSKKRSASRTMSKQKETSLKLIAQQSHIPINFHSADKNEESMLASAEEENLMGSSENQSLILRPSYENSVGDSSRKFDDYENESVPLRQRKTTKKTTLANSLTESALLSQMDARKYGQHGSHQQHQHLFKPIQSNVDKYPTKGALQINEPPSTYNQYKQQSDQLQSLGPSEPTQRKEGGSVGPHPTSNLKAYSNRAAMTRVPSQIINPAAVHMRDSSGQQRIDESYDNSKHTKFKIEYQPAKNSAITRKQSKVNTLVNSLMANSNNTTGILQNTSGQKVMRQKKPGNRTVQKSLESPLHKDSKAQEMLHGGKLKQPGSGLRSVGGVPHQNATGPKKRFYNSMVVTNLVSETTTPKVVSQSSHHVKEKFSLDNDIIQQHMFSNRQGPNLQINKQLSGNKLMEQTQQPMSLAANTPSRRKSRQNQQNKAQQISNQNHQAAQYNSQGYQSQGRSTLGSVGQRRRASKQMMLINSQSQLQTSMNANGDYQLTSTSQIASHQPYSPSKPSKLYKSNLNRNSHLTNPSQPEQKSYIPINSGTYSMPNGGRSETGSATGHIDHNLQQMALANNGSDHQQSNSVDPNGIYDISPHKQGAAAAPVGSIYNQYVNNSKQGGQQKQNVSKLQSSGQVNMQQEYNQQVPVSSYYLLHGKYNAKGGKTKSSSVKATDLGITTQPSTTSGKGSLIQMQQLANQIGKPQPKSHSHGISTPTAIQPIHMPSPSQGSVMNVPKHLINPANPNQTQPLSSQIQYSQRAHEAGVKSAAMRETPTIQTGQNSLNRQSEGPPHIYGSEIKTMPGSTTSTKRNSINPNVISSDKSMRGGVSKKSDGRALRNSDQLRTKPVSRHKRKNNMLSATQQNISDATQNFGKMRTNSSKQTKERVQQPAKHSERQSSQFMSQELDGAEDNSAHTSNMMNPRSRGLMLQQSIDRPSEQMRATQGANTNAASSMATSVMTSPKVVKNGDSVNQSNSRRSHGSSNVVLREHDRQEPSLSQSKEGALLQTAPRKDQQDRSSLGSPAQDSQHHGSKGYHQIQIQQNKLKYKGVNVSTTNNKNQQSTERYTPVGKDANANRKILQTNPKGVPQPRILSKTTKNSTAASKEHLHRPPNGGQNQGQNLINQYVSTKKRGLRRNISGERISSIERTSQVAEQIFWQQPPDKSSQGGQQKKYVQSVPTKVPPNGALNKPGLGSQALSKQMAGKHPSQSSFESAANTVSPSMMSGGQITHGSLASDSQERFRKQSMGGATQGSSIVPLDNPLMIQEQEEENNQNDQDCLSPRSREVGLLTKVITDCFDRYNKMPKTRIELYKVGKILGKGAFGKVNLGLHRLTRRLVAIKSTDKDQIKEESTKRKMMQEIDILKSIKHTSHIKLLETFQTAKHYLIVMELCPGGDLLNYVRKRRKLTEKNAKYLFKQIMQGIAYMHTIGIVHRDIKLDNILLDGHGNVKIGDFGVSRRVDQDELLFEQCGTPAYIAPEIVQEIGYKGFPVDIWSAGVCLYAILYGNVPFKANQIGDLTHELYQQEIEYRDTVSELARDLMQNMLEKNVSKRLSAKEVLYHPWFDDTEEEINIFDEQEKNLIRKEFTYILHKQKMREYENRSPCDLNTEFTEHSIGAASDTGLLKNSSTRSVILCPFNSRQADVTEQGRLLEYCLPLMEDKDIMLRFGIRVRELDRAYEKFNNQDFDNGVYHKYAYKNQGNKGEDKKDEEEGQNKPSNSPRSKTRQTILQRILEEDKVILPKRVMTPESEKYAKIDMGVVEKVANYGFPQSTIINSLRKNLANHCTTSYYLLLMEQVF